MAGTKTEVCGRIKLGINQPLSPYIFSSSQHHQVRNHIPICRSAGILANFLLENSSIKFLLSLGNVSKIVLILMVIFSIFFLLLFLFFIYFFYLWYKLLLLSWLMLGTSMSF